MDGVPGLREPAAVRTVKGAFFSGQWYWEVRDVLLLFYLSKMLNSPLFPFLFTATSQRSTTSFPDFWLSHRGKASPRLSPASSLLLAGADNHPLLGLCSACEQWGALPHWGCFTCLTGFLREPLHRFMESLDPPKPPLSQVVVGARLGWGVYLWTCRQLEGDGILCLPVSWRLGDV